MVDGTYEAPIRRLLDRRGVSHIDSGPFTVYWDGFEKRFKINKSVGRFTQHHITVTGEEMELLKKAINSIDTGD